ncbi:MAG: NTP/NDP exchange transporter [Candidatus Aminicenantales bacterium]
MQSSNHDKIEKDKKETPGLAYRFLGLFTTVYPGEALTAFLLMLNVYLLLAAYYIIKPVREALILAGKGAEWESYLNAAIAVLLVFVVKAFSAIASRFPRQKLITWVTLFFISNLVIFYILSLFEVKLGTMGIIFFVWMGIFNVMVVAQFWGFANDVYTPERGKRLFPLVAFGATFGAFSGSAVARRLVEPIGLYQMMLVSGAILGVCIMLTWIIHIREVKRAAYPSPGRAETRESAEREEEKPLKKGGGFQLLFKKRYLLYIALLVLFLNFINTNGQYILGNYVEHTAKEAVSMGTAGELTVEEFIGKFQASFMMWFNLLAMLIQLFVVSRIFKWLGVRMALLFLPFIALGGYFLIALGASLMLIHWVKVAENGTDYSLMNTTRHALFLITSREEKYKAKAATDTFFHRAGDVLSALLVFLGTTFLAFTTENFAAFNMALVAVMLLFCFLIIKEHKKLSAQPAQST